MLKILTASDLLLEVQELFTKGMPRGDKTGWVELDRHLSIAPGYWTAITGIPSHGKSTWMDNLMVRLFDSGWKFCVYSPENQPHEVHVCSIAEKIVGKPISRAYSSTMSAADLNHAISVIDAHIRFLALPDDATHMANLDDVLQMADEVLEEFADSKVALLIDPWNELDHTRPDKMTETEYISYQLSKWRQFHRSRGTHGFLVAHPAKPIPMRDGTYPVPDLYAINGSAHWKNKCDNGVVVWRNESEPGTCEIHVKKVKFKHHGRAGIVRLDYEASTGRYFDPLGYSRKSYAGIRSNQFPEDHEN